jgi:hypothetical protein
VLDACDRLRRADAGPSHLIHQRLEQTGELGDLWSPQKLDIAQQRLAPQREALELAHQVTDLEQGYYPMPSAEIGTFPPLDHLDELRRLARLLRESALLHAQRGQMPAAAADLAAALRMAASLGNRPLFIEALVGMAVDALAVDGLERSLAVGNIGRGELAALAEALAREDARLARVHALPGERAITVGMLRNIAHKDAAQILVGHRRSARWFAFQVRARIPGTPSRAAIALLDSFKPIEQAYRLPLPERREAAQGATAGIHHNLERRPFEDRLALYLVPAVGRYAGEQARSHARMRAARTSLAVEQWRLEHGRWPESLDELVPELLESVPTDPFTGEPLRYRRTERGVRVYSLGADGEDQDGIAREERDEPQAADWVHDLPFRLLDPDERGARRMTFRDELEEAGGIPLEELERCGYGEKELRELGFSESEIRRLLLW